MKTEIVTVICSWPLFTENAVDRIMEYETLQMKLNATIAKARNHRIKQLELIWTITLKQIKRLWLEQKLKLLIQLSPIQTSKVDRFVTSFCNCRHMFLNSERLTPEQLYKILLDSAGMEK
jgi:hypothetical protein